MTLRNCEDSRSLLLAFRPAAFVNGTDSVAIFTNSFGFGQQTVIGDALVARCDGQREDRHT